MIVLLVSLLFKSGSDGKEVVEVTGTCEEKFEETKGNGESVGTADNGTVDVEGDVAGNADEAGEGDVAQTVSGNETGSDDKSGNADEAGEGDDGKTPSNNEGVKPTSGANNSLGTNSGTNESTSSGTDASNQTFTPTKMVTPTATPAESSLELMDQSSFFNLVKKEAIKSINSYRSDSLTEVTGGNAYASLRANQIVTNFKHDSNDIYNAALMTGLDDYVYEYYGVAMEEQDMPMLKIGSTCYLANEALVCTGFYGLFTENSAKYLAEEIAGMLKDSAEHWAYLGDESAKYVSVGLKYDDETDDNHANCNVFACVVVWSQ